MTRQSWLCDFHLTSALTLVIPPGECVHLALQNVLSMYMYGHESARAA